MEMRVSPEVARLQARSRGAGAEDSSIIYSTRMELAVEALGIESPSLEELRRPNTFTQLIDAAAPRVLAPGESLRVGPLSFQTKVEELPIRRADIHSSLRHTVGRLENHGPVALAYQLRTQKAGNDRCQIRAMLRYDAMVLDPGEVVEISLCTDSERIEITDLRTLTLTPVGAHWVGKLSPRMFGADTNTARAHNPGRDIVQCTELAHPDVLAALDAGEYGWEDIVDYFSRHDCGYYAWLPSYRLATEPTGSLPVL